MFEFQSALFQGDALLQAIVDDQPTPEGGLTRISRAQNADDPAVQKVQIALLDWRPDSLPEFGADGGYGEESARAIHRFKAEELGVPENEIIDDVGPLTVQRLDAIRAAAEAPELTGVVTLVNQYGEPLGGVGIIASDGTTEAFASSDETGQATLAITAPAQLSLDESSLLSALGGLLERPAAGIDPGGATVVVPGGEVPAVLEPGAQLDLVVAARIDLSVKQLAPLEGSPRVEGPGLQLGFDGESVFLALQAAGGEVTTVEIDSPPSEGVEPEPVALDPWVPPAGYVVQAEDTESSLGERFFGDPTAFARLSDHPPVPGELLNLPPEAVPGWIAAASEPLPDPPLPQVWFTVSPDAILAVLYQGADPTPYHELVELLQGPPAAAEDPLNVATSRAEAIAAFLALGAEGGFGEEQPVDPELEA